MPEKNESVSARVILEQIKNGFKTTMAYGPPLVDSPQLVPGTDNITFTVPTGDNPAVIIGEIFRKNIADTAFKPVKGKADSYTVSAAAIMNSPNKTHVPGPTVPEKGPVGITGLYR